MTDLDQRMRRVRIALLLLGIPFVCALVARAFQAELLQEFPIRPDAFDIAALVTGGLVLLVVVVGWFGDRQALRRQERQLLTQANELALNRQKLEARDKQHLLELSLKDKQIEKEVAVREERGKLHDLEHTLSIRDAGTHSSSASEDGTTIAGARRGPPPALSRPRRTLVEADAGNTSESD